MSGPGEILDMIDGVLGDWDAYNDEDGWTYCGPTAMRWVPPEERDRPRDPGSWPAGRRLSPAEDGDPFTGNDVLTARLIHDAIDRMRMWVPEPSVWWSWRCERLQLEEEQRQRDAAAEVTRRMRSLELGCVWGSDETVLAVDAARDAVRPVDVPNPYVVDDTVRDLAARVVAAATFEPLELRVVDRDEYHVTVVAEATGLLRLFPIPDLRVVGTTA